MYKPCDSYTVDSVSNFITSNKLNQDLGKDFAVLLDSTRTVIAIGDPLNNPKAEYLFFRLMDNKITYIDSLNHP